MDYKALTFINLPYTEHSFAPGDPISHAQFEEYVNAANAATPDLTSEDPGATPPLDVDEVIAEMIKWGSLSDDADAPLHPDHLPVDPSKPTLATMVEQARQMREAYQEAGKDVPPELDNLADMDYLHVSAADKGQGGDSA